MVSLKGEDVNIVRYGGGWVKSRITAIFWVAWDGADDIFYGCDLLQRGHHLKYDLAHFETTGKHKVIGTDWLDTAYPDHIQAVRESRGQDPTWLYIAISN